MITNGEQSDEAEKWYYITLKSVRTADGFNRPIRSLSNLFRGITANNNGDISCLGCLHSFWTDNALKRHERLRDNNDYCCEVLSTKVNKTLKYNHSKKSLKAPLTIYVDLGCLLIQEESCQNNPKEPYTEKKAKHEPSGYSLSLICSFNSKEIKYNVYRGRDCIQKFCKGLKEPRAKIINYKEKDMIPLTDSENKFYAEQKECHICQKKSFVMIKMKKRNLKYTKKLEIIVIIQENLEEQLIAFAI